MYKFYLPSIHRSIKVKVVLRKKILLQNRHSQQFQQFCIIITIRKEMNSHVGISYERSLELFKNNQLTLPEKIKWKLHFIAKTIAGEQTETKENLPLQYQLQIQDLKDVTAKGLKIIFTSIIQTLFNEQIPIDKQCSIRRKGFFKSWTDGFIKYDDTYIYFNASNKTSRYRFRNIDVSLNSNSKRAFDFFYKGDELMTVKFEKPQSMQAMFKTIKSFIYKEKNLFDQQLIQKLNTAANSKPKKNKPSHPKSDIIKIQQSNHKIDNSQSHSKTPSNGIEKRPKRSYNTQNHPSRVLQFEKSILSQSQSSMILRNSQNVNQHTKQLKLNPIQQGYLPKQSSKKMFMALHSQQIKLNLQIIINHPENLQLEEILSCLCLYKNWNSKVLKEELCFEMKYEQQAIIYRVYEKSNAILSKSRQTYTILEFKRLSPNTAIVLEESLDNQDRQEEYVRAYLKTLFFVQMFGNTLKICVESQFNPKGYCSHSQSQQLLLTLYKDIIHFENYLSQYSIKNLTQKDNLLFERLQSQQHSSESVDVPESPLSKSTIKTSAMEFETQKSSDEDYEEQSKKTQQIYRRSTRRDPFLELKPSSPHKVPTIEFLELIRKRQFQKYFLKHKFESRVLQNFDANIPWYCLQELLKKGGQYEITENLELKFINQQLIQSQKDILRFLIKQIGANLISGKSVLNVSLPVDIFEPRTLLQRSASSFGKCPDYLLRSFSASPLEQIMNVTAFIASVPTLQLIMQKPFNPILGETFQCYLKGIPLCYEQISHHPPISSYYMECPEFKLYGNLIAFADVGLNSGVGGNLGVMNIVFKNGYHYQCHFPPSEISGLIYGDRKFRCYGRGYIIERSQNLFAQFSIEKQKKGLYQTKDKLLPGSIIGGVFKVNKKFIQLLNSYNDNLKKFPGLSKDHVVEKLVHISGMWFDKIYMNERIINQGVRAYPVQYYPYSLPSDANFRLDVLYHKQNNLPESQKEKEILQNIQRQDRKLRQRHQKSLKRK